MTDDFELALGDSSDRHRRCLRPNVWSAGRHARTAGPRRWPHPPGRNPILHSWRVRSGAVPNLALLLGSV